MGKLVGVIASVLVGLALATGATYAVTNTAGPDKDVNLEEPATPNGATPNGGGPAEVNYGSR